MIWAEVNFLGSSLCTVLCWHSVVHTNHIHSLRPSLHSKNADKLHGFPLNRCMTGATVSVRWACAVYVFCTIQFTTQLFCFLWASSHQKTILESGNTVVADLKSKSEDHFLSLKTTGGPCTITAYLKLGELSANFSLRLMFWGPTRSSCTVLLKRVDRLL